MRSRGALQVRGLKGARLRDFRQLVKRPAARPAGRPIENMRPTNLRVQAMYESGFLNLKPEGGGKWRCQPDFCPPSAATRSLSRRRYRCAPRRTRRRWSAQSGNDERATLAPFAGGGRCLTSARLWGNGVFVRGMSCAKRVNPTSTSSRFGK